MHRSVIFLCFLCLSNVSIAQVVKVVSDFRVQTELGIEKKFLKNWNAGFENTYRWIEDASRLDEIDFDFSLGYKAFRFMNLSAGYRFRIDMKKQEGYNKKHRYNFDVSFRHRFGRFTPTYRIRYQNMDDDYIPFEDINQEKHILRNRLLMNYDIRKSKLTPFIYLEVYGQIEENYPFGMRLKTSFGCKYRFEKAGAVKAAYRIDRELNADNPYTYYNLELGYVYEF
jgi:hypothetical protein